MTATNTNQIRFQVDGTAGLSTLDALEIRLYRFDANQSTGNTHITAPDANLRFTEAPIIPTSPTTNLQIDGDYQQLGSGTLCLELAGTAEGEFDLITIAGNANLNDELNVTMIDKFQPQDSDLFEIMTANQIVGTFSNLIVNGVTDRLNTKYNPVAF